MTQYQPGDVAVGEQRYLSPEDGRTSCTSCHASLSVHSTRFLADLTDDEILKTAVEGIAISFRNPDTEEVEEYTPLDGAHTWNIAEGEGAGLLSYLRSRPPEFNLPDFQRP